MKNYTFEKDETGKITNIFVDGKPVKRCSMRGFRKAQETTYFRLYDKDCLATNQFSGVTVCLNGLEATIYAFCMKWYMRFDFNVIVDKMNLKNTETSLQTYDDMKYFLLEINPQAYMDLID